MGLWSRSRPGEGEAGAEAALPPATALGGTRLGLLWTM